MEKLKEVIEIIDRSPELQGLLNEDLRDSRALFKFYACLDLAESVHSQTLKNLAWGIHQENFLFRVDDDYMENLAEELTQDALDNEEIIKLLMDELS